MIESLSLTCLPTNYGSMPTTRRIGGRSMTGDSEYMSRDSVEKAFVLMLSLFSAVLTTCSVNVIDVGQWCCSVIVAWRLLFVSSSEPRE